MQAAEKKTPSRWVRFLAGGVLLAAVLAGALLLRPGGADYTVTWVGSSPLSQAEVDAVCAAISQAGADQNGDGQVTANVRQYLVDFSQEGDQLQKLLAQVKKGDCRLYLLEDPEGFQRAAGALQFLDGSAPLAEDGFQCANWGEMCVPWLAGGLEREGYLARALCPGQDASRRFPGADILFDALTDGC